ncbi:RNA polymerase sigma-70 factor [Puteibacter caeruleilacunae]|nr:RNA polymerase sigma-70 factor [Puteibacter caeruleilacunae]
MFQMKKDEMTLLQRIQQDDVSAFETLFRRYIQRLYSYALKIVDDDILANDIVQDVYIKVWEKRKEIRDDNVEGLLFRMIKNQCISYLRHIKVVQNKTKNLTEFKKVEEVYRIDFVRNEPYLLIEKELQEEIVGVMNGLPVKCKEVFRLSRVEGLKNAEVAEHLGVNIKTVEKHIAKALAVFKDHFGDRIPAGLIIIVLKNFL